MCKEMSKRKIASKKPEGIPRPAEHDKRLQNNSPSLMQKSRPKKCRRCHTNRFKKFFETLFFELHNYFAKAIFVLVVSLIVALAFSRWNAHKRANYVRRPFPSPTIIPVNGTSAAKSPFLFWGTYNPGIYFGVKHRSPHSINFGLIWVVQDIQKPKFRYLCDQNDGPKSYNWIEHDGINFGRQKIVDDDHNIYVSFVKRHSSSGGDWTVRISVESTRKGIHPRPISLIFYSHLPDSSRGSVVPLLDNDRLVGLQGNTVETGSFLLRFHLNESSALQQSKVFTYIPREDAILQSLFPFIGVSTHSKTGQHLLKLTDSFHNPERKIPSGPLNGWFYEATITPPFTDNFRDTSPFGQESARALKALEVEFRSGTTPPYIPHLTGAILDALLDNYTLNFREKFDRKMNIDKNRFTNEETELARVALANLLGGIGFFYGSSLVQSPESGPTPIEYWPAPLFTATPSRPQFPRGFLWDEGFHGLVLVRWNIYLALETFGHWLDLMNIEGWIPREQILGWEARARVPERFIVQSNSVANPPALVLAIESLLDRLTSLSLDEKKSVHGWSLFALPRLHSWYQWFNNSQRGPVPTSYRWRGRSSDDKHQLNPLTLGSGLDDYPRSSHPTDEERHLDLRCWMTVFAKLVARIAHLVSQLEPGDLSDHTLSLLQDFGQSSLRKKTEEATNLASIYRTWADVLLRSDLLDDLHWSSSKKRFSDWGLHTDYAKLVDPPLGPEDMAKRNMHPSDIKRIRLVTGEPRAQLVTSAFGYLSLFPLLLRLLPPDSPHLLDILSDLSEPHLLWSPHGLRSLSLDSVWYAAPNTQDDPAYWRGAIWINMNYLAWRALRYYSTIAAPAEASASGPRAVSGRSDSFITTKAAYLADQLSRGVVRTVLGELRRTGFFWEQFNDTTGRGQRAHPFSGWTSLVVLMMSSEPLS